jgi:formate C-acetyltransferase
MEQLKEFLARAIREDVLRQMEERKNLYVIPSPFLSLFFDGCLENGRDISEGCVYNNWGFHGTGLAPAADMLAAADRMVLGGEMTAEGLIAAMDRNFEGAEKLREKLRHDCPKMGNDDGAAPYAAWLLHTFAESVRDLRNERGGRVRAGTGSAMYYITHAEALGATADGREAGVPLPANYAPSLNIRLNGPLSLIRDFTVPELREAINGGPLTVEFSESVFSQEDAVKKVAQLVRMFIRKGGHQIQLNTVNREKLLDAQRHPENYRNLIVRVWGWSGYFTELDRCYQDHIIRRAELSV